jgi:hypothetical protein
MRIIFPGRENATREFASGDPVNKKNTSGIKIFDLDIYLVSVQHI